MIVIIFLGVGTARGDNHSRLGDQKTISRSQTLAAYAPSCSQSVPSWAEELVLFGVIAIDGVQIAYLGSTDHQTVLTLSIGEKLPSGIQLTAVHEPVRGGSVAAELVLNGETAVIECLLDESEISESAVIIEAAPTTQLPLPPVMPLLFPERTEELTSEEKEQTADAEERRKEDARPAVVAWPRKNDG